MHTSLSFRLNVTASSLNLPRTKDPPVKDLDVRSDSRSPPIAEHLFLILRSFYLLHAYATLRFPLLPILSPLPVKVRAQRASLQGLMRKYFQMRLLYSPLPREQNSKKKRK